MKTNKYILYHLSPTGLVKVKNVNIGKLLIRNKPRKKKVLEAGNSLRTSKFLCLLCGNTRVTFDDNFCSICGQRLKN